MRGNNRGVILITVLWIVLILSLVAWGLSRRSALEVSILSTYQGKVRSYAAARAGVNYVLDLLNTSPSNSDSLYSAGINIPKSKTPKEIFSHIDVGEHAYAIVEWKGGSYAGAEQSQYHYGLQDEQGKINVNAINGTNYQILSSLFQLDGLSRAESDRLALAVSSFKETGQMPNVGMDGFSLKDDGQGGLKPKNKPYENLSELIEVGGMTKVIFEKVKNDLTVYGEAQNGLRVNVNTASNRVLQALTRAAKGDNPLADTSRVVLMANLLRDGNDGISFTADDGQGMLSESIPFWPPSLQVYKSSYLRARVEGVDELSGTRSVVEAVIERTPGFASNKIVGWQRE